MQFDFSAVNENNLNLSRIWLPVKERLLFFFELNEFYF